MNSETIQAYARRVLLWVAGMLTTYGVISPTATWVQPAIGVLVTVITFAWSIYGARVNGLLGQLQGKDGVQGVELTVDPSKINPSAVEAATPPGVTAKAA